MHESEIDTKRIRCAIIYSSRIGGIRHAVSVVGPHSDAKVLVLADAPIPSVIGAIRVSDDGRSPVHRRLARRGRRSLALGELLFADGPRDDQTIRPDGAVAPATSEGLGIGSPKPGKMYGAAASGPGGGGLSLRVRTWTDAENADRLLFASLARTR